MSTNCVPLFADLLLFCYKRGVMLYFSDNYQSDVIGSLSYTSRYLDALLNIDNPFLNKW